MQDSGMIKGKWRLGKVVKAEPSLRDGLVRTVDIQYKNPDAKSFVTITRPVQRIVVILPIDEDGEFKEFLEHDADAVKSAQQRMGEAECFSRN